MLSVNHTYLTGNSLRGFPVGGQYCLVVHPLTSPCHIRQTPSSLDYLASLKEDVTNQRNAGKRIVWLLDGGVGSHDENRAIRGGSAGKRHLDMKIANNITSQIERIFSKLDAAQEDVLLVTAANDPMKILTGPLSRITLADLLKNLKPGFVHINGETYNSSHAERVDTFGCVNNVAGVCLDGHIPYEVGPVLYAKQAF